MQLDIRLPLGLLFAILGLILTGYGIFGPHDVYARSLGYDVNLDWGVVLLVFGVVMYLFGRRGTSSARIATGETKRLGTETSDQIAAEDRARTRRH